MKSYVDLRSYPYLYETEAMSSSDEKNVITYCKSVAGTRSDISHTRKKKSLKACKSVAKIRRNLTVYVVYNIKGTFQNIHIFNSFISKLLRYL